MGDLRSGSCTVMYAYIEQGYDGHSVASFQVFAWLSRVRSPISQPGLLWIGDRGLGLVSSSFEAILLINMRQRLGVGSQRHQYCTATT
jgi:hypothetical protein